MTIFLLFLAKKSFKKLKVMYLHKSMQSCLLTKKKLLKERKEYSRYIIKLEWTQVEY
jgi:hypothetical protein